MTSNEFIQKNWMAIAIFVIVLCCIIFLRGCFPLQKQQSQSNVINLTPAQLDSILKPRQSIKEAEVKGTADRVQPYFIQTAPATAATIPLEYQNLPNSVSELTKQVQALVATLYATNHYDNTIALKDSTGKQVGEVNLPQDVSGNKLQPFTPTYKLKVTTITDSVPYLVQLPYKERNRVFFGGGLMGDQYNPISGLRAGLIAQNKKGWILEANATRSWHYWGGEIGMYKLISFRKK